MSAWPRVRLDQCTEVVSGATPDTSESTYWDGDICWATPKDLSALDGAYISSTPRKITRRGLESCAASVLPPESVLFSSRAPIGHVAINTVPMATNQGFKSFVPDRQKVDAKFLYHWLRKNRPYLESLGNGATFKEVSKAVVSRIEIALPPLPKQRQIAEILDKADALRAKRRAALAQFDTLTQSIFLDLFGDPRVNPRQWPKRTLGELLNIEWGNTSITKESYVPDGIPAYSASGRDGFLVHAEHAGEGIVLSAIGARCGRCFYVPGGPWTAIKNTITMRPKAGSQVTLRYVLQLVDDEAFWPNRGAGQPFIALGTARAQRIAVPPIELQQEFTRRVVAMSRLKHDQNTALTELDTLFDALQYRAFRGEL